MTEDLEETLRELGPGYREVADRLFSACEKPGLFRRIAFSARPCWLAAASVAAIAGFAALFVLAPSRHPAPPLSASGGEYRLALAVDVASIREMIRTQNADGSWKTDFLTKRNAAALKGSEMAEARVAYKKAMRNLRMRGVL